MKRMQQVGVVFALSLMSVAMAQTIHLEAEAAKLSGPNLKVAGVSAPGAMPSAERFSGSGYITGFRDTLDRAVFEAKSKNGGLYELFVAYRTDQRRGYEIEVNGLGIDGMLPGKKNHEFAVQTVGLVELKPGKNEIAIDKGWGYFDVDYIELKPAVPLVLPPRALTGASDPDATDGAKALLAKLDQSYGKATMLGVYKDRDAQYVQEQTGVRPGIMGGDLLAYSPQEVVHGSHPEKNDEVGRLISRAQEGYVITLSWHWCSPTGLMDTKAEPWWKGFYTEATNFDVAKTLADPTSPDYATMLSDIDAIAVQLRRLQDAGVPVLWRPLHEAGGGWFWWGAKGPKASVALWQLVYDRLTKVDGIHNLVWVYTGGDGPDWYPGDRYVDVVGIDQYPKDLHNSESRMWADLVEQYGGRKVLAISEFGGVPDIPKMQGMGEFWSYAVSWSDDLGPKKNTPEELKRIYASPGVMTLPPLPAPVVSTGPSSAPQ